MGSADERTVSGEGDRGASICVVELYFRRSKSRLEGPDASSKYIDIGHSRAAIEAGRTNQGTIVRQRNGIPKAIDFALGRDFKLFGDRCRKGPYQQICRAWVLSSVWWRFLPVSAYSNRYQRDLAPGGFEANEEFASASRKAAQAIMVLTNDP